MLRGLLAATRPNQWVKNFLVLAAPATSGALLRTESFRPAALAVLAFLGCSCGGYLVNDTFDLGRDRAHPFKRYRPVAAGVVPIGVARVVGTAVMLTTLGACWVFAETTWLPDLLLAYCLLTVSYSAGLKQVAYLELLVVAACFALRAVAGGVVDPAPASWWVVAAVTCAALFVVAGKRYRELNPCGSGLGGPGTDYSQRPTLRRYVPSRLRLIAIVAAGTGLALYAAGAVTSGAGQPWVTLSVAPVAAALARYATLLGRGLGERPEAAVRDAPMVGAAASWVALVSLATWS
jgi:decaprenyl-phosphate phosphoribosyltransferase